MNDAISPDLHLSPETERILRAAGWWPTRRIDTSRWVAQLEQEGFRAFSLARQALGTLGGITVQPPARPDAAAMPERFSFLPIEAASGEADRLPEWERRAGTRLFPLGEAYSYRCLLLGEDGRVYAGDDTDTLYLVGDSLPEALDALALGSSSPEPLP